MKDNVPRGTRRHKLRYYRFILADKSSLASLCLLTPIKQVLWGPHKMRGILFLQPPLLSFCHKWQKLKRCGVLPLPKKQAFRGPHKMRGILFLETPLLSFCLLTPIKREAFCFKNQNYSLQLRRSL